MSKPGFFVAENLAQINIHATLVSNQVSGFSLRIDCRACCEADYFFCHWLPQKAKHWLLSLVKTVLLLKKMMLLLLQNLQGEKVGRMRMYNEECRDRLLEKRDADGFIPMEEHKVEFSSIDGDEEKEFYQMVIPLTHTSKKYITCRYSNKTKHGVNQN